MTTEVDNSGYTEYDRVAGGGALLSPIEGASVAVNLQRNKLCLKCELPFRDQIDDDKYRWCLECRKKKREKNKKERTTKKRKIVGNPSFDVENPNEDHFQRFDSFDNFLQFIANNKLGEQTDAIFQTVLSEQEVPRFPKHFNFVTIGLKTVVKRRGIVSQVSGDDDEAMKTHIDKLEIAPVVASYTSLKSQNLATTPLLSLVGIYVEKKTGLIIVNQTQSGSFVIQNSAKFLDLIVQKLLLSPYNGIFQLNAINSTNLQDEISKLFTEYNIDQHDALQAYRFCKDKKFSMLRDLPTMLSQLQIMPKLKNTVQAKLLRQKIDEQLIKFADRISSVTEYQYLRKRRDVSQNGNFVINHYCRQDSHYRKLPTIDNRKTEDCKSKLALFYNSIDGNFKIIYTHKEHGKHLNENQITMDYISTKGMNNIDMDLINQQQQNQTILNNNISMNPGLNFEQNHTNSQWRSFSNVLSFNGNNPEMGL